MENENKNQSKKAPREEGLPLVNSEVHGVDLGVTQDDLLNEIQAMEKRHLEEKRLKEQRSTRLLAQIDQENEARSANPESRNREAMEFKGREFEERQMLERRFWSSAHLGRLYINPENIPSDEIWYWAAKEVNGKDNLKHINSLLGKEWSFVRPHECPELCRVNEYAQEIGITQTNFVTNDASILLKRKKWIHDIEVDIWLRKQREVEEAIVHTTNSMSDEKIAPTFVAFNNKLPGTMY